MGIQVEIEENVFLKDAYESGLEKGRDEGLAMGRDEGRTQGMVWLLRDQIRFKFGPVPTWVEDQLRDPSPEQTERWAKRLLSAARIEDVFSDS